MRPFQVIAHLDAGGFAVLSVDPAKRVGKGCEGIVMSLHKTEVEANSVLSKGPDNGK